MPPRAKITTHDAWLGKDFGEQFARRLFGEDVVAALPRYVKGKNVGKHKATIRWMKCESGGWVSRGVAGYGYVENRVGQVLCARLLIIPFRGQIEVLADKVDDLGRHHFD